MMCNRILDNLDDIKQLTQTVKSTNKLQIAVSLYLECEFIVMAMRAVAVFTNRIILPYLNMVAQSNQLLFSENVKQLYEGLEQNDLNILEKYAEPFKKHAVTVESELEQQLLNLFSSKCAIVLKRCVCVFYFSNEVGVFVHVFHSRFCGKLFKSEMTSLKPKIQWQNYSDGWKSIPPSKIFSRKTIFRNFLKN